MENITILNKINSKVAAELETQYNIYLNMKNQLQTIKDIEKYIKNVNDNIKNENSSFNTYYFRFNMWENEASLREMFYTNILNVLDQNYNTSLSDISPHIFNKSDDMIVILDAILKHKGINSFEDFHNIVLDRINAFKVKNKTSYAKDKLTIKDFVSVGDDRLNYYHYPTIKSILVLAGESKDNINNCIHEFKKGSLIYTGENVNIKVYKNGRIDILGHGANILNQKLNSELQEVV